MFIKVEIKQCKYTEKPQQQTISDSIKHCGEFLRVWGLFYKTIPQLLKKFSVVTLQ